MFRFTDNERYERLFEDVRQASWLVVAAYVVFHSALLYVFFSWSFFRGILRPAMAATGGYLTPVLLTNLIELVFLVIGVAILAGGLRWRDLGLSQNGFVNGFLVSLLIWATVHVVMVSLHKSGVDTLQFNAHLSQRSGAMFFVRSVEATFGSALVEEITYRGFLMPQLFLLLAGWLRQTPRVRLALAVGIPQILFALNHIPAGMRRGLEGADLWMFLLQVLLMGFFFAALYLRTGNLWIAIAVHSLINYPATLFVTSTSPSLVVLVVSVFLILAWPLLAMPFNEVFTLSPLWRGPRRA